MKALIINRENLETVVFDIWNFISDSFIEKLYSSMTGRMKKVLQAQGLPNNLLRSAVFWSKLNFHTCA